MSETVIVKEEPTGVFFVWQRGARGPVPAVVFGEKPIEKRGGDRAFILTVHTLEGDLREAVQAAADQLQAFPAGPSEAERPKFPWGELKAAYPAPAP